MKKAVVLGGTVPHIDLICELKRRGYRTILVDNTKAPPAKEYADKHIRESTLDKDIVLSITKESKADLVISSSVDQANVVCCYVAEKLGLPHPYSFETALDVTDKARMKSIMLRHGIPTSKYISLSNPEELKSQILKYPIMLKPADSNSAKGVKKAENIEEAIMSFHTAIKYSRNGLVIAEECVRGVEISAYGYILNHKANVIMIQERISTYDGPDKVIKCFASLAPARISDNAKKKAKDVLESIADAFGLENTPLFFQGFVDGDNISVIEFAPRTGGGISTKTIKNATGFDFISATIDSYIGKTPHFDNWHPITKVYAVNQIYANTGVIKAITGWQNLQADGLVDIISFYRRQPARTDESTAGKSRVFVIVVSGFDEEEVKKKINKVFDQIDVIDENGKSIIRKDLSFANTDISNALY